jgi:hypothetical protein
MASLSHKTVSPPWRILGLSVAASYAAFGTLGLLTPVSIARNSGLLLKDDADAENAATTSMIWISIRDLTLAAALFALYYQGQFKAMGTVILSSMISSTADCILVYRYRTDLHAHSLVVGAALFAWIGWNLIQL